MVTAPYDEWTEELCIRLIQEYKKRPILWDPRDQFFFKKAMKPEAWEGIAAAIGMPLEACKHKMVILQSSFRREKSKIMQNIKTSAENTKFTSSWFAFEEMAFLIDKDRKRKTQGNYNYDSDEGPSEIKRCLLQEFNEKQKQSAVAKKKPTASNVATVLPKPSVSRIKVSENLMPEPSPRTTEKIITVPAPASIPPLTQNPTKHKEETLEEIKSFTNFIAFKMKKYSETTKNSVQQAICDIIFKADQNFYETVHANNYVNFEPTQVVIEDDCDIDEKTIDIGDGQTIMLQMLDSE